MVTALVLDNAVGWTHKELRSLLHVPSHASLLSAVQGKRFQCENSDGICCYLSIDPAVADREAICIHVGQT